MVDLSYHTTVNKFRVPITYNNRLLVLFVIQGCSTWVELEQLSEFVANIDSQLVVSAIL